MSSVSFALADSFLDSLIQIPKSKQKKVATFIEKFRKDPKQPGINYEKINAANDPNFRSVRIDRDYRGIVLKPETGSVFIMLIVARHDDAYTWASRHSCRVHPNTGTIQLIKSQKISRAPAAENHEAEEVFESEPTISGEISLLFSMSDNQLSSIGVPQELIDQTRQISSVEQLEALETTYPKEAFEALYLLAAGTPEDEVFAEYAAPRKEDINVNDFEAALKRPSSKRSFALITEAEELQAILDSPLEKWRVFLHPTQRKLVERDWNGPVRVLGTAGTGKTVVAMHRALWLAENVAKESREKILFTTFTTNLAVDIEENLKKICSPDLMAKIDVTNLDSWVARFLQDHGFSKTIVYESDRRFKKCWRKALRKKDKTLDVPDAFYLDELRLVVVPNQILTSSEYLRIPRTGRGTPLTRRQRVGLWPVFEEFRRWMENQNLCLLEDAKFAAAQIISSSDKPTPYKSVIVDESQDMGAESLKLIRCLAGEGKNDLFLVGDGHQRIYRRSAVMSHCGVKIVGRGRKLRINYRTTEETRKFSIGVLKNIEIDDLDGGTDTASDCRSLTHGKPPEICSFESLGEQHKWIASQISELVDSGTRAADICVVARTNAQCNQAKKHLKQNGLNVRSLSTRTVDDRELHGVRVATMHRVKGLEFRFVFVCDCNDTVIPLAAAVLQSDDEVEQKNAETQERALFHVALTRAINQVFITSSGKPSTFIAGMKQAAGFNA